jgi:hypothetical protein
MNGILNNNHWYKEIITRTESFVYQTNNINYLYYRFDPYIILSGG